MASLNCTAISFLAAAERHFAFLKRFHAGPIVAQAWPKPCPYWIEHQRKRRRAISENTLEKPCCAQTINPQLEEQTLLQVSRRHANRVESLHQGEGALDVFNRPGAHCRKLLDRRDELPAMAEASPEPGSAWMLLTSLPVSEAGASPGADATWVTERRV